jgi:hypothetical protein
MCNDVEGLSVVSKISGKMSLVFYCEMKHGWDKESYVDECTRKERKGIMWLKAGIRKLKGIKRGFDRGRCPLCLGRSAKHTLLKCPEKRNWRE